MSTKKFTFNTDKLAGMKRHLKNLYLIFHDANDELKEQRTEVNYLLKRQEDLQKKQAFEGSLPELVEAERKLKEIQKYHEEANEKAQEYGGVLSEFETAINNWNGISSTRHMN